MERDSKYYDNFGESEVDTGFKSEEIADAEIQNERGTQVLQLSEEEMNRFLGIDTQTSNGFANNPDSSHGIMAENSEAIQSTRSNLPKLRREHLFDNHLLELPLDDVYDSSEEVWTRIETTRIEAIESASVDNEISDIKFLFIEFFAQLRFTTNILESEYPETADLNLEKGQINDVKFYLTQLREAVRYCNTICSFNLHYSVQGLLNEIKVRIDNIFNLIFVYEEKIEGDLLIDIYKNWDELCKVSKKLESSIPREAYNKFDKSIVYMLKLIPYQKF